MISGTLRRFPRSGRVTPSKNKSNDDFSEALANISILCRDVGLPTRNLSLLAHFVQHLYALRQIFKIPENLFGSAVFATGGLVAELLNRTIWAENI